MPPHAARSGNGDTGQLKRNRVLAAVVDVVDEVGYARMTVARVIARARVSRKTFYDVFSDREDCFLAAFEQSVERARSRLAAAYAGERDWRDSVRAALGQLLLMMDEQPGVARLCVVESLSAGDRALERRAELLDQLTAMVDRGRLVSRGRREPPRVTAEGLVGGVFAVLHKRLTESSAEPLTDLRGPLMSMIVLPYLGEREAQRELDRPAQEPPSVAPAQPVGKSDPLAGLEIRLTYRTVRVLTAIDAHPGASNREIAERAGVVDQGQISKLLTRLERLKLIENSRGGHGLGTANAWSLTARGAELERATRLR
jgi:AcrR family transcriptional regulator